MAGLGPAVATPLLVVGEALVDVVSRPGGPHDGPGPHVDRHVGGSPTNVAIGLSRLGHVVQLATCLGADRDGDLVRAQLDADGVTLAPSTAARGRTSTANATLDATGSATYEFDLVWDLAAVDVSWAGHIHTGSIAATLQPGASRVHAAVQAAHAGGATTSYDPNLRPRIMGGADDERPGVEALVAAIDTVKASDEDLAWLYPGRSLDDVAQGWAASGPALVVITRGAQGALAWRRGDPGPPLRVRPQPVTVVDTVGAGDSFMAGLLSGLADAGLLGPGRREALLDASPDAIGAALQRAVTTSAITCSRPGSDPPRRAELPTIPECTEGDLT